ncbi:FHA domain-containing protein [bacterium]|nr:FHA domain-containing protein [bacterium]
MRRFSVFFYILAILLISVFAFPSGNAVQAQESAPVKNSSPVILIQSEIAGEMVFAAGVVILTGKENCHALTSYEAVKGAARIMALGPDGKNVPASLLRFAPDANLALLEVPIPNLPAARIGDSELLKNDMPLKVSVIDPEMEGSQPTGFTQNDRKCTVLDVIKRPTGAIIRLKFNPGISDETSGAPLFDSTGNELMGIVLSLNAADNNEGMRFAIPVALASAVSNNVRASSQDTVANIRVLDGSEAPVLEGTSGGGGESEEDGSSSLGIFIIIGAVVIVVIIAIVVLKPKKPKVEPFSVIPMLPPGMDVAFVTSDGRLLPSDKDMITVGRSEANDWSFAEDQSVSGRHAKIRKYKGNDYEIEDLGSTNGTYVRGRKVGRSEMIHPGDIVRLGRKTEIKLVTKAEATMKNTKATRYDAE